MPSPTYHNIGDHTETVQIDYDPSLISYEQLLDIFWNSHDPTRNSRPGQYMRAVFFHDDRQRQLGQNKSQQRQHDQSGRDSTPQQHSPAWIETPNRPVA